MRRALLAAVLGLAALTAQPASAGCVEDFLAPGGDKLELSDGAAIEDDGTVTVHTPWFLAIANRGVARVTTFAGCVV